MTEVSFEYGKDGAKIVLVGLDGSRTSWRAVSYAAGVARRSHSTLIVVHVQTASGLTGLTPQAAALNAEAESQLSGELRSEVLAAAGQVGLEVVFEVRQGEPEHALEAAADQHQADVVVVGSSESRGHRLVGSTAVRLVRAGKWPVTVIP